MLIVLIAQTDSECVSEQKQSYGGTVIASPLTINVVDVDETPVNNSPDV